LGKGRTYVQTKVKQAVRAVERKAAQTIKRTAEDVIDRVQKRQKGMPRKGLIGPAGQRGRRSVGRQGMKRRRKFSRNLRKRRSGYNGKSLARAMRKIALNASQTKRHNFGTGLNVSSGDVTHINLNGFQTQIFKMTHDLRQDVATNVESWEGNHFFLKGINIAGQVSNESPTTRVGVRIFMFKDEVSGYDYTTMDSLTSAQLLWYNKTLGTGSSFVALPEPYKHAPKLMKGQNAKMIWSQNFELDFRANGRTDALDAATFKKYLPINREMYNKTTNSAKPQCQWWFGVTWYKLDLDQSWDIATNGQKPAIGFTGTVYFKDP
jgi:hypothetical protein